MHRAPPGAAPDHHDFAFTTFSLRGTLTPIRCSVMSPRRSVDRNAVERKKQSLAGYNDIRYSLNVIRNFVDKEAEGVWNGIASRRLPADIQSVARRKLRMLNSAVTIDDLRVPPGNRLELLKGDRKGQHSIRINDQWRICFRWREGDVHDVEIVDYH
jgi:proteic killer suppression protein